MLIDGTHKAVSLGLTHENKHNNPETLQLWQVLKQEEEIG